MCLWNVFMKCVYEINVFMKYLTVFKKAVTTKLQKGKISPTNKMF